MSTQDASLNIVLPDWLNAYCQQYKESSEAVERMRFVIEASQHNIDKQSGGPFAAGVFESDTGRLIALGVNLVSTQKLSILHAEMVALSLAQKQIGSFDLRESIHELELITSTEPCAMCLGAIPWSGINKVITGASGHDAEAIGFDEGEKPNDWQTGLEKRGIKVITGVCQAEARAVLDNYARNKGQIY